MSLLRQRAEVKISGSFPFFSPRETAAKFIENPRGLNNWRISPEKMEVLMETNHQLCGISIATFFWDPEAMQGAPLLVKFC